MLFLLISLSCLLCAYVLLLFMFCDYAGLLAFWLVGLPVSVREREARVVSP